MGHQITSLNLHDKNRKKKSSKRLEMPDNKTSETIIALAKEKNIKIMDLKCMTM